MPLLQPFVTPGLVVLGAGIGAVVAAPPATPEPRGIDRTITQELPVDGAATEVPRAAASTAVTGIGDTALSEPLHLVDLTPSLGKSAAPLPSSDRRV